MIHALDIKAQADGTPRMSRSEAARHASLVRWKKEQPRAPQLGGMANPAIAARVKEILAEKAKKKEKKPKAGGKGKGKGKGKAAKPKESRTPQEKANQNRTQVAKQSGMEKLEGPLVRLAAGMRTEDLEKDAHDELIKKGLAERHANGTVTLSASGKKWKAAADKGDASAAQGALTDAEARVADKADKDKVHAEKQAARDQAKAERQAAAAQRKAEREKAKAERAAKHKKAAKKALEIHMDAIKAGARHNAGDMKHLQSIHDGAVALGAMCGPKDDEEAAVKMYGDMLDDPVHYAMHECGDIQSACQALSGLSYLLQSELSEDNDDEDTVSGLVKAARLLIQFIENELDEVESYDAEDTTAVEDHNSGETVKAIGKREDVNPKAGVAEYGDVQFADAKNKKYPIDTPDHVRSAWNYINKADNAAKYDPDEVKQIKTKIVTAWKKLIDEAGPPSAAKKGIDDLTEMVYGSEIKALDGDQIGGFAVLFGTAETPDASAHQDYFDAKTNYWLDRFGWPRPMTYHHGLDEDTRDDPIVGSWTKAIVKNEGIWLEGQLDRAHRYHGAIKELIKRGYLKLSSDSAPQWVQRERQPNGANYVKRWPLLTASPTVTPAEPRMSGLAFKALLAELGLDDIDDNPEAQGEDSERSDGTKAIDERARRMLLELDLLALEVTTDTVG
jgi:Family of unknown function (DUF6582)